MIFSLANFKGGVGKTTCALNLGFGIARQGYKTLLVDTDPQSNLTFSLGLLEAQEGNLRSLYESIRSNQEPPTAAVIQKIGDVSLLPASLDLASADLDFGGIPRREYIMQRILAPVKDDYDVILIDCPPSMGLLTQNALAVTDIVLIPTLAEFLPAKGIQIFIDAVQRFMGHGVNPDLAIGGIIICQYNPNPILSRQLYQMLQESFPDLPFDTSIRRNIALSEAQARGQSIFDYDPESRGAEDYLALTKELLARFTQ